MTKLELRSVVVSDKPGKGAHTLSAFQAAGVNFIGVWAYPLSKKKSRIDLVPEDPALLKKTAKQLKIDIGKKQTAFHISGEDHAGALAQILAKLAAKGINVYAAQALCAGAGKFGALVQVEEGDVKKAAKLLG
jgi:hypothetical protein